MIKIRINNRSGQIAYECPDCNRVHYASDKGDILLFCIYCKHLIVPNQKQMLESHNYRTAYHTSVGKDLK